MYLWKRVMGNVPQDSVFVPPDLLKSRGFTTQDEMTLFNSRVSQDDAKPSKQYGLESRGFKDLMQDFKTCSGRRKLMMVASCPRVSAGESTLYTQARRVLQDDMDPHAIVMVHHSGKCVAVLRDQDGTIIEKHMRKRQIVNSGSITSPRRVRIVNITTAGEALTKLENMYCQNGVDRRFIAIGYNAFARTASVRTSTMVITHMFAILTKGRHSADVRQTLMRPAGRTTNVRKENNGGVVTHVKVVTLMEDWHMVTELYKFQVWLAEKRMEDPEFNMMNALCPLEYDPVVASNRSHAPNTMRFRPEWRVDATHRERRMATLERRNEQREREHEQNEIQSGVDDDEDDIADFIVGDRDVEYEDDVAGEDLSLKNMDIPARRIIDNNRVLSSWQRLLVRLHQIFPGERQFSYQDINAIPDVAQLFRDRNYMTGKELRKRGLMVTTIDDTPRNVGPYKLTREGSRLAAEIELHMG
jgi:hypothetical protein